MMRAAAFVGLAGEVIDLVAPRTEADPAGLLTSFLVGFGAAVGAHPHAIADGARHPARLNLVLVGASSRARKGTSWAVIRKRSASLSALLRQAWDGDDLAVLTRGKPLKVSGANVSLIGHITSEEQ